MSVNGTEPIVRSERSFAFLGLKFARDDVDRMRILTWIVMFGLALTVSFAVFGLPPFQLPMPTWAIGIVTPTCGLTRATTALARGEFGLAWMFNPAAFLLAVAAVASIVRWVVGRTTGVWVNVTCHPTRAGRVLLVVLFLVWWANQQLHADLIMHGSI